MLTYTSWNDVPHYLMTRHGAKSRGYTVGADAKPVAQITTRPGRIYDLYLVDKAGAEYHWAENIALRCKEVRRLHKAQKNFERVLSQANRILAQLEAQTPPLAE